MFMVEIDGLKVLYTGDFSCEDDMHLKKAEVPNENVDILIVESTYGIQIHESREMRENRLLKQVTDVVKRGGKVLMPVFALGRAQEILLILDAYWNKNKDIQKVPILYASNLAKHSLSIYQSYSNMLSPNYTK